MRTAETLPWGGPLTARLGESRELADGVTGPLAATLRNEANNPQFAQCFPFPQFLPFYTTLPPTLRTLEKSLLPCACLPAPVTSVPLPSAGRNPSGPGAPAPALSPRVHSEVAVSGPSSKRTVCTTGKRTRAELPGRPESHTLPLTPRSVLTLEPGLTAKAPLLQQRQLEHELGRRVLPAGGSLRIPPAQPSQDPSSSYCTGQLAPPAPHGGSFSQPSSRSSGPTQSHTAPVPSGS